MKNLYLIFDKRHELCYIQDEMPSCVEASKHTTEFSYYLELKAEKDLLNGSNFWAQKNNTSKIRREQ